jgi:hypothetical protein
LRPDRFFFEEEAPCFPLKDGWMLPRNGLDTVAKREKVSAPGIEPQFSRRPGHCLAFTSMINPAGKYVLTTK